MSNFMSSIIPPTFRLYPPLSKVSPLPIRATFLFTGPAFTQACLSTVKGQPFAYKSNLPLHRACIHPSMFVRCQRSALCLSEQPSSSQGLHSPKHVCPLSKVSPLPIRATFLFTGPAFTQACLSTVKGQPFAYQSNLPLHRACKALFNRKTSILIQKHHS